MKRVYDAPYVTLNQILSNHDLSQTEVRLQYSDKQSFETQAKKIGIMFDFKVSK